MNLFHTIYTILWISACLVSLGFIIARPGMFAFTRRKYYIFLCKPWKLWLFALGFTFMTFIAPFSGDYTWDYVDGGVMSMLTFLTSPWTVGIFYRMFKQKGTVSFVQVFVAVCLWMFSASWFYDIYIFLRSHYYPPTWYANLVLSSMLYGSGGLLWNLDWSPKKGVFFSFTSPGDEWFSVSRERVFFHIIKRGWIYIAIVLILCAAVIHGLHSSCNR